MKKIFCISLILIGFGFGTQAQNGSFLWTYEMGLPTGNTADYIESFSWRGMGMEWRSEYSLNMSYGFSTAWQVFYEARSNESFVTKNGAVITGNQYRYINTIPLVLTGQYKLNPGKVWESWIGGGIGTHWFKTRTQMGLFAAEVNSWNFAIDPEIGVVYDSRGDTDIILAIRYNMLMPNKKFDAMQSYVTFKVGFSFE
jgi:outer membrane protein